MTERRNADDMIKCDVCGNDGFWDPREPWETWIPKPTHRCSACKEAVKNAIEQKQYLNKYYKESK